MIPVVAEDDQQQVEEVRNASYAVERDALLVEDPGVHLQDVGLVVHVDVDQPVGGEVFGLGQVRQ